MNPVLKQLGKYIFCPVCKNDLVVKQVDNEPRKVCSKCGFIYWNNPNPSATVLLHKDRKVLMLQRNKEPFLHYWVLPGGYLESSETPQETAIRETKEEAGILPVLENIIGVYRTDNDPRGIDIDIIFSAKLTGTPTLSKEHTDWKIFDTNSLPEHIAYKHRQAIMDWASLH